MLTWPKLGTVNICNNTLLMYFSIIPGLFRLAMGILAFLQLTKIKILAHGGWISSYMPLKYGRKV